jgi:hypothetical protein
MSQRPLVITSAALTALALLGAGIFMGRTSQSGTPAGAMPPDREAAYRTLIAEANARLEAQNEALRQRRDAAPAAQPTEPEPAVIGADAAGRWALEHAPGAKLLGPPELVSYQGQAAYEARLDVGTLYLDARAGRLLYDGTAKPASSGPERWLVQNERGERHHGRQHHEEEDGDDD